MTYNTEISKEDYDNLVRDAMRWRKKDSNTFKDALAVLQNEYEMAHDMLELHGCMPPNASIADGIHLLLKRYYAGDPGDTWNRAVESAAAIAQTTLLKFWPHGITAADEILKLKKHGDQAFSASSLTGDVSHE